LADSLEGGGRIGVDGYTDRRLVRMRARIATKASARAA
jgi:hypothetical protein